MVKTVKQLCNLVTKAYLNKSLHHSVLAWWNWSTFGIRSKITRDEQLDSYPILLSGHPLYCKRYRIFGDESVGGLSEGRVTTDLTPEFGLVTEFVGEISGETSHKMYSLPFISFISVYNSKVSAKGNGVRVIIRRMPLATESELEKEKMLPIQIQLVSSSSLGFTEEFTATICPTNEWKVFELPLAHWSKIRAMGANFEKGVEDEDDSEANLTLKSLTIMVRSQKSRPFRFQVASAEIIANEQFSKLHKVFPKRPVFFEALPDYTKATVQDYFTYEEFFAYKLKRQEETAGKAS